MINLDIAHNYLKLKFSTNLIISLTRVINKDKTWIKPKLKKKKNKKTKTKTHKQKEINKKN